MERRVDLRTFEADLLLRTEERKKGGRAGGVELLLFPLVNLTLVWRQESCWETANLLFSIAS